MKKQLWIINGANLNLLGKREPSIYGNQSFEEYFDTLKNSFSKEVELCYFQSNHEGKIIDKLHELGFDDTIVGIVLNAGAFTHTSVAIGDAISSINTPVIEVHISNTFAREEFRHKSYLSKNCIGVIVGFGMESYRLGIEYFINELRTENQRS
ncbi:type II 3-dehydroquinate dehydratase [Bernardetia sp.]|uniref:type II 3-dehydroquinate dehydratase n=1 Tax=Bernardetia sp. TaxID=1937974 RepID=UPI0025BB43A7|nr:type II 3-dehydroquinate dehydratase [Bernardetia sp.]